MHYNKQYFLDNLKEELYTIASSSDVEDRYRFLAREYFGFFFLGMDAVRPLVDEMLKVAQAVTSGTSYELLNDPDDRKWFLATCNISFMSSRLEIHPGSKIVQWKSRVRTLDPCAGFIVSREEFAEQIKALVDFLNMK